MGYPLNNFVSAKILMTLKVALICLCVKWTCKHVQNFLIGICTYYCWLYINRSSNKVKVITMAFVCMQKLLVKNFNNQHNVKVSSLVREVCMNDWENILCMQLPRMSLCKFEYEIQAQVKGCCCYLLVKLLITVTQR